ncbi:hypothetical protein UlMin_006172 [Ulmus minor]
MARGGGGSRVDSNSNGGNRFASLDGSNRPISEDPNKPFHLSNNDHPRLNLVLYPLVGSNYNSWSCAITMALIVKNKLSFVDGTFSDLSPDDKLYAFWYRCNSIVMSWLLHAVSKEITDSIMYINNVVDAWNDLHD